MRNQFTEAHANFKGRLAMIENETHVVPVSELQGYLDRMATAFYHCAPELRDSLRPQMSEAAQIGRAVYNIKPRVRATERQMVREAAPA